MTNKHGQTQNQADPAVAVVLFGMDAIGKPKAARFGDTEAKLATKVAEQMRLQVLPIAHPVVAEIAAQLPAGRVHARGRGVVPHVPADLYAKLVSAAAAASHDPPAQRPPNAPPSGTPPSGTGDGGTHRPKNWDDIAAGHSVLAQESHEEGWYDAVVVERSGELAVLRWRQWPRDRRFTRHYRALALLCPNSDDVALPAAQKPKAGTTKSDAAKPTSGTKALPETWGEIDVGSLVLAATEGPWPSWWEAVVTENHGPTLTVRWRDFPKVPTSTRARASLALICPSAT